MKLYLSTTIPLEAQYLYRRGMEMVNLERADAALICFRQVLFIAPCFSKVYRELGNCLARLDRSDEASAYLQKASRIDSTFCSAAADKAAPLGRVWIRSCPGSS